MRDDRLGALRRYHCELDSIMILEAQSVMLKTLQTTVALATCCVEMQCLVKVACTKYWIRLLVVMAEESTA